MSSAFSPSYAQTIGLAICYVQGLFPEQLGTWGLKLKTFLRNPAALNARVGITRSPGGSDGKEVRASEAVDGGPPSRSGKVRDREGGAMAGMG